MTRVAILPVPSETGVLIYRAVAGDKHSEGRTVGEALDLISSQLSEDESGTLVVVQNFLPDEFFGAEEQSKLKDLMARWRTARDKGESLSTRELAELEALVDRELRASGRRAADMARSLES
jgi:hypothetical protein